MPHSCRVAIAAVLGACGAAAGQMQVWVKQFGTGGEFHHRDAETQRGGRGAGVCRRSGMSGAEGVWRVLNQGYDP